MAEHAIVVAGEIVGFRDVDPVVRAEWAATGNPKASRYRPVIEASVPAYDTRTETVEAEHAVEPDLVVRSWTVRDLTADERRRTWSALEFLSRFTTSEMGGIEEERKTDPIVQAFYRAAMAAQEVVSDDPRTVAGMNYLVSTSILTAERRDEILDS